MNVSIVKVSRRETSNSKGYEGSVTSLIETRALRVFKHNELLATQFSFCLRDARPNPIRYSDNVKMAEITVAVIARSSKA